MQRHVCCLLTLWIGLAVAGLAVGVQTKADKKDAFKPGEEEQAIIDATNKERDKQKLPPLKPNEKLFKAAQAHAENMAKKEKMEHVLDGKNPLQRIQAAGYVYAYAGENLAHNQRSPEQLLKDWMASEHHRENILREVFTEIGIGIAKSSNGEPYYCQVFGTPRRR